MRFGYFSVDRSHLGKITELQNQQQPLSNQLIYELQATMLSVRFDLLVFENIFKDNRFVVVEDMLIKRVVHIIDSEDDVLMWSETLGRIHSWAPRGNVTKVDKMTDVIEHPQEAVKAAVHAAHHKSFLVVEENGKVILDMQWLEAEMVSSYRNRPKEFAAAVEMQVRKYLNRNGKKDDSTQELLKALWYLKFLVAFMANDMKPFRISEIDGIIKTFIKDQS